MVTCAKKCTTVLQIRHSHCTSTNKTLTLHSWLGSSPTDEQFVWSRQKKQLPMSMRAKAVCDVRRLRTMTSWSFEAPAAVNKNLRGSIDVLRLCKGYPYTSNPPNHLDHNTHLHWLDTVLDHALAPHSLLTKSPYSPFTLRTLLLVVPNLMLSLEPSKCMKIANKQPPQSAEID